MTIAIHSLITTPDHGASATIAHRLNPGAGTLNTYPFPSQNRSRTNAQRWVEKTSRSITKSETPQHLPIPDQGRWLASVIRGHCNYYAVPSNSDAIIQFRTQAIRHWHRALRRRSQRHRLDWQRMRRLEARWLPPARVVHPYPEVRFDARTQGRSPVR